MLLYSPLTPGRNQSRSPKARSKMDTGAFVGSIPAPRHNKQCPGAGCARTISGSDLPIDSRNHQVSGFPIG